MFTDEIKHNTILQWALGSLVFIYFVAFYSWVPRWALTTESFNFFSFTCPPYFQSCGDAYIFQSLPFGYSQPLVYMLLFTSLLWAVYLISEKRWYEVQLTLLPSFLWHASLVFIFSDSFSGNYEYYVFLYGLILLFLPHKEFFLKLVIVILYFLSTVSKIYPSWIEGGYFTALKTGLPFFSDWSIPIWTNVVILSEMVGAWFLLSSNRSYQKISLVYFVIFHLYSGLLVYYRYPATVLPMLLAVFGPWYRPTAVPLDYKSFMGWGLIALLLVCQFMPKFIDGDEKLTLEGDKYGLYMFEANHQCISEATIHFKDGRTAAQDFVSSLARNRCNPYDDWFRFKQMCERVEDIERIEWTFDHSVNGGPFLRIVDVDDTCMLNYKPFSHNEWIKTRADNPEVIGYPVKNLYY